MSRQLRSIVTEPKSPRSQKNADDQFDQHSAYYPANRFLTNCQFHSPLGDLDRAWIDGLSEDEALQVFCDLRWRSNGGDPQCPRCSSKDTYSIRRRRYRCSQADCRCEFSATTGTLFASRKLPYRTILMAIFEETQADANIPVIRFREKLNIDYKTAFSLHTKLRVAMGLRTKTVAGQP